jgi:hypothetical protein
MREKRERERKKKKKTWSRTAISGPSGGQLVAIHSRSSLVFVNIGRIREVLIHSYLKIPFVLLKAE